MTSLHRDEALFNNIKTVMQHYHHNEITLTNGQNLYLPPPIPRLAGVYPYVSSLMTTGALPRPPSDIELECPMCDGHGKGGGICIYL